MNVLLDSSAWLAHIFGEGGCQKVGGLLSDDKVEVYICSLTIPEVFGRLKSLGQESQWPNVWAAYQDLIAGVIPVDIEVARCSINIKQAATGRLPTIDSLIAASAQVHSLLLVHRDTHMLHIPDSLVPQLILSGA